jgi:hypothetical protein
MAQTSIQGLTGMKDYDTWLEEPYYTDPDKEKTDEFGDYDDDEKQEWPEIGQYYTPPTYERD